MTAQILYTLINEAPYLATASFLPIVQTYAKTAGVDLETRDISLAARIAAQVHHRAVSAHRASALCAAAEGSGCLQPDNPKGAGRRFRSTCGRCARTSAPSFLPASNVKSTLAPSAMSPNQDPDGWHGVRVRYAAPGAAV